MTTVEIKMNRNEGDYKRGKKYTVDAQRAEVWVKLGWAEYIKPKSKGK